MTRFLRLNSLRRRKSKELIRKPVFLTSDYNAEKLRRYITVEGRSKSEREKAFYILDRIITAIEKNCKARFQYADYNNRKRKELRLNGEAYIVSPYALVWDGDYYYMIGYCDNREHMRHFCLDRIFRILDVLEDEEAVPAPKDFKLVTYMQKIFRMYGGDETVDVELQCEIFIMNSIVDQFGTKVMTKKLDDKHFKMTVTVTPSPTFYRLVFRWNGAMNIIDKYKTMARKALES